MPIAATLVWFLLLAEHPFLFILPFQLAGSEDPALARDIWTVMANSLAGNTTLRHLGLGHCAGLGTQGGRGGVRVWKSVMRYMAEGTRRRS
jgi:hypothetical protein